MKKLNANQALQRRSKATESRLLDAAESLLEQAEWDDISIAEIALAAGSSVGGVYARFPSKDALLLALHQRYEMDRNTHFEAFLAKNWGNVSLSDRVRGIIDCVGDLMQARRAILRTFLLRYWRRPEEFGGAFDDRLSGLYAEARTLLALPDGAVSQRDQQRASAMAIGMIAAFLRDALVLKPAPGPGAVKEDFSVLKEELSTMVLAYLQAYERDENNA